MKRHQKKTEESNSVIAENNEIIIRLVRKNQTINNSY